MFNGPSRTNGARPLHHVSFTPYTYAVHQDYLNEAVDMYQDLRKISATSTLGLNRFYWGNRLSESLELRFLLLHLPQDAKELMQLSSELANDDSGEVFIRFNNARHWALSAHILMNPLQHFSKL